MMVRWNVIPPISLLRIFIRKLTVKEDRFWFWWMKLLMTPKTIKQSPYLMALPFSYNGNRVPKKTTCGWKLLCQWTDGSTSWVPLVELKDLNPVELAKYAVGNKIDQEPALFRWWVADVLRKRNQIIAKVKRQY
jgi:hypothetical protein